MTSRLARCLLGIIATAMFAIAASASPAGASSPPPTDEGYGEARIIWLLNEERRIHGLSPLANNGGGHNVAQYSAEVQAWNGRLAHNPNLPNDVTRNVSRTWTALGENVGCAADADQLHSMWMASSPHARNMMNPRFDTVGVGVTYARGCLWATVIFVDM